MAVTQQAVAGLRHLRDHRGKNATPRALTASAGRPLRRAFTLHLATLRWRRTVPRGLSWRRLFRTDVGMIDCHTMPRPKIAVSLDAATLARLDRLVARGVFANRSRAVEQAVAEKLERLEH